MKLLFLKITILLFLLLQCCNDKTTNPLRNSYQSVTIGTQVWMLKNLDVDHYRNGDIIPEVKDPTEWSNLSTGAWSYCNEDSVTDSIYGKFYNWYAVNDPRGLAPEGWHIPSDEEWKTLEIYLGMSQSEADKEGSRGTNEGGKLKEAGTVHWKYPNIGATNETGFTALPGGFHYPNGNHYNIGIYFQCWTSTEHSATFSWFRNLAYGYSNIFRAYDHKENGFSVRCIKNN
ncbi:MAG: fibrobacter succinogenes major paralogous domain-containing protein [Bacteroidota bacterium]